MPRPKHPAAMEVRESIIEGNGTAPNCQQPDWVCNGIAVKDESQTTIIDSKMRNNADWGVAAALKKCGYDVDNFTGKVTIDDKTVIEGNNKAGNHQGEVCLP